LFQDAVEGHGAPSATGEDGVKSLSVAISTLEAARSGAAAPIDLSV
jgi:1,5-anhydro-D-fructose reductase (1,5-anhydro-D-mannitol-forming)